MIEKRSRSWGLWFLLFVNLTVGLARADVVTYFHNDISGTPMAATDAAGNLLWKEAYRPYGERLLNQAGPADNRLWFGGKAQDPDTGLSYLGARYYNPQLGRFTGVDPKEVDPENPHSFNRYAYANNNPYKFIDPDGRTPETFWDAFNIGLGVSSLIDNIKAGNYGSAAVDAAGVLADSAAAVIPLVPGGAGSIIKVSREGAEVAGQAATKASDLPVVKPGTQGWNNAVNDLGELGKGKLNVRTETASDAQALLREGRGNMNRYKNYTNQKYEKGYETHNSQNSRELGAGNDLQHLKWKDGKSGGHIYYDKPN